MLTATDRLGRTLGLAGSPAEALQAAAQFALTCAGQTPAQRRGFRLALAGPTLAEAIAEAVRRLEIARGPQVELFLCDGIWNRARARALEHLPHLSVQRPAHGDESPHRRALLFEQAMRAHFALAQGDLPRFDLILAELGPDGRLGTLLPQAGALRDPARLVVSDYLSGEHHLSITPAVYSQADCVLVLANGAGVAEALGSMLDGRARREGLPAGVIDSLRGRLVVVADHAAASRLPLRVGASAVQYVPAAAALGSGADFPRPQPRLQ